MEKKTTFFTAENVQLKNFKGIKDFNHRLDGECCLIIGSEAVGKTNLLQSIFMILKQYPSAILKQGEDEGSARITISKGEAKYEFRFNFEEGDKEARLRTLVDGEKLTMAKQSEVIKSLTPQTFDLNELINAKGQAQADLILKAFDIDVSKEKEAYKEAFDERKLSKRSLDENSHFAVKEEVKEVDTKALKEEIGKIDKGNELWQSTDMRLGGQKERLIELTDELKTLHEKIVNVKESIKAGELFIKEHPKTDTTKLEEKLSGDEATNTGDREYKEYLTKVETKKKKKKEVDEWETKVNESQKAIIDKINSAKLPVPKLIIKTDIAETSGRITSELTYNGLPFDDESINTAERIAIGAKLQMSLFKPGNLGIITLNAGSVGNNTIKSISEECAKKDLQVLWELTSKDDDKKLEIQTVLKK